MKRKEFQEPAEEDFFEEEETPSEPSFFWRFLKIFIALVLLFSLLYITGIREYFFYRKTPIDVKLDPPSAVLEAEKITVPVSVFILREGSFRSERKEKEVESILEKGFQLFEQANIGFEIKHQEELFTESNLFLSNHSLFLSKVEEYKPEKINIFLVGHLKGINGIAFPGRNSLAVADYVTSHDYRTLAHEIGHIFGLGHNNNPFSIMYQGSYGLNFSLEEVLKMREEIEMKGLEYK